MTRIEQEKKTVSQMVEIHCHGMKHTKEGLCEECSALLDYAYTRLEHCKFGEKKPTCKKCPIHCYKPDRKIQMQAAMRYALCRPPYVVASPHCCNKTHDQ